MGTGMVPGHILAQEGYTDTYGHRKVAQAHMGTRRVSRHIWTPDGCQAHKENRSVPRHIRAPAECPGTYGHRNGAQEIIGTGMVSRHI